jgi:hypothetical protein
MAMFATRHAVSSNCWVPKIAERRLAVCSRQESSPSLDTPAYLTSLMAIMRSEVS